MDRFVDISFDCLPLRSISRMDVPIDASPKFRAKCERIKSCLERHGSLNTYYLHNAKCVFHLTNAPDIGMLEFAFDGVVTTNETDDRTLSADLDVRLVRETCDWLTEPIVAWFADTVRQAVSADFNLYIAAGDLARTKERLARMQAEMESNGGFLGMGL